MATRTHTDARDIIDRLERIEDRVSDVQRIIDLQIETIAAMRREVNAAHATQAAEADVELWPE